MLTGVKLLHQVSLEYKLIKIFKFFIIELAHILLVFIFNPQDMSFSIIIIENGEFTGEVSGLICLLSRQLLIFSRGGSLASLTLSWFGWWSFSSFSSFSGGGLWWCCLLCWGSLSWSWLHWLWSSSGCLGSLGRFEGSLLLLEELGEELLIGNMGVLGGGPSVLLQFLVELLSSESLLGNKSLDLWSSVENSIFLSFFLTLLLGDLLLNLSHNDVLSNIILLSKSKSCSNVANSLWSESSWSLGISKS